MRDLQTILSDAQSILSTGQSTNVLDLTDALHQIGQAAHPIRLRVAVADGASGSATSINVALQDCDTAGGSYADTSIKVSTILKAKLVTGALLLDVTLPATGGPGQIANSLGAEPPGPSPLRRFIAMEYTLTGGKYDKLKLNAWIEPY